MRIRYSVIIGPYYSESVQLCHGSSVGFQVVEYLLRNHASVKTVDSFGRTALHHATTDDVKALLHSARSYLGDRSTCCWLPNDDAGASTRKYI